MYRQAEEIGRGQLNSTLGTTSRQVCCDVDPPDPGHVLWKLESLLSWRDRLHRDAPMRAGFPQYSHAAKLGELGVSIVSRVISDTFGWLFKRNHQEHDVGIDGQVELVTDDGAVTGQMLAVQIKCGKSFLR